MLQHVRRSVHLAPDCIGVLPVLILTESRSEFSPGAKLLTHEVQVGGLACTQTKSIESWLSQAWYDVDMHELRINGIGFTAGRWPLDGGLPTVIFIHGSGGTSILWHAQVEALAGKMNTIALDLPGHGRSDGEGMNRIEDYTARVDNFVGSIEAPRPVPCGLSIGGAVVLQLLLDTSDKYEAGIIVNSGARLRVLPLIFEAIENDYAGFVNASYTGCASERTDPSRIKPLVDSMAECPPVVTSGDFAACDSFDVMERIAGIDVPLLVLTASEDRMTPAKYGKYLADNVRNSSITNIEDAGHFSPMEKPEEVTRAILQFVESL